MFAIYEITSSGRFRRSHGYLSLRAAIKAAHDQYQIAFLERDPSMPGQAADFITRNGDQFAIERQDRP